MKAPRRCPARVSMSCLVAAGLILTACREGDAPTSPSGPDDPGPALLPPGTTPQIAFVTNRNTSWDIYRINSDATGLMALHASTAENEGRNGSGGYEVAWSPDGSEIAYTSDRYGLMEIYIMAADGTANRRLTYAAGNEHDITWSPDGEYIAFARVPAGGSYDDVWTIHVDGSGEFNVTATPAYDEDQPDWSPVYSVGGRKLAIRWENPGTCTPFGCTVYSPHVATVSQLGGTVTLLTPTVGVSYMDDREGSPRWSPDAGKIAFVSDHDGDDDIYTVTTGANRAVLQVVNRGGADAGPRWSPAGTQLAFWNGSTGSAGVWVVSPSGTGLTQVALTGHSVRWSPDGTRVAYVRPDLYISPWPPAIRPVSSIYTVSPTGASPLLVVSGPMSLNERPEWRP